MISPAYIIVSADLHINSKVPENRKGDYLNQTIIKFEHLLNITKEHSDAGILIVAGDMFDSPTVPYKVTKMVLEKIKENRVHILVVPGQHDLRYHVNGLENTPLGILQAAGVVEILTPKISKTTYGGVSFVGAGWNEEPEEEADILVMHRMITKKGELWPGQTNYSSAHAIMRKYPWASCIVSGDNHLPHSLRIKNTHEECMSDYRLQINCGSMMRSTKSQIGFQPRCYKVNLINWTSTAIKIPCLPAEDVFDFGKISIAEMKDESKKLAEEKISKFIDSLPKNERERPQFKTILNNIVAQIKPKDAVKTIIQDTMERIS